MAMKPSAWENEVTAPEPLPIGNATGPCSPGTSATSTNSCRPISEAIRIGTVALTVFVACGGKAGAGADHRRDEFMEGEDRRGRESRQHRDRLAVDDREAQRLAGLERHAMDQHARRSQPRQDAIGQIARALGGAAGQHHHIARGERVAHRGFEHVLVVGKGAHGHGFAAGLGDRGGDDRAVAVIDRPGGSGAPGETNSSPVESTATRGRRSTGTSAKAAGREHADLARADALAAPQHRLAAGHVGAGKRHELPGADGAAELDRRPLPGFPSVRCAPPSSPRRRRAGWRRRSRSWSRCRGPLRARAGVRRRSPRH